MLKNKRNKNKGSNGQVIHTQILTISIPDTVVLGIAVEERFLTLCQDYLRIKGEELPIPSDLDSDLLLWRTMLGRHRNGDYRDSMDELKATRRIADWLLKTKCDLVGKPYVPVDWYPLGQ